MIVAIVGPRCSGKTALVNHCVPATRRIKTCTTRARRSDESEEAYEFLSEESFESLVLCNEFLECTEYADARYGSRRDSFNDGGVIVVDPRGLIRLHEVFGDAVFGVYLCVSAQVRCERMILRGMEYRAACRQLVSDANLFGNIETFVSLTIRDPLWCFMPMFGDFLSRIANTECSRQ
jgi:guanylate kinase